MSPPHPHSHDDPRPAPAWARRVALLLLIPAALLTAVGLLLWPHDTPDPAAESDGQRRVFGTIAGVAPQPCPPAPEDQEQPTPDGPVAVCGTVTVTLTSGPQARTQVSTDIPTGPGALQVSEGDDVVLLLLDQEGGGQGYTIVAAGESMLIHL